MPNLTLFDASHPSDHARWIDLWRRWPSREVSAHPDYARLFARSGDRVLAATWDCGEGCVILPFLLRRLGDEPWGVGMADFHDWTTPYGYGGAFAWNAPDKSMLAEKFWREFDDWAAAHRCVAGFARLSLFPDQTLPFAGETIFNAPNVVRSLDLDADAMWMDYEHKVRKNVKHARQAGLEVEVDLSGARLGDFMAIYYATLQRRAATSGYYFSEAFFHAVLRDLPGQFAFFHVKQGEQVVSTELVLVSSEHVYSFLGGTSADAFALRPNELLKHAVIEWARSNGKKAFVLGGGYEPNDGIFRYKLSFAPKGVRPFSVGTRVYDDAAYQALVQNRRNWESAKGVEWTPKPDFFPAYRG